MSWDSYIDNLCAQSRNHIDRAAIMGMQGGMWTSDTHPNSLTLSAEEMRAITAGVQDVSRWQMHGVTLGGVKYQFLRGEAGGQILAKRKGEGGITIQPSNTAIVMAHCKEGGQQGSANNAVAIIVDYLKSQRM